MGAEPDPEGTADCGASDSVGGMVVADDGEIEGSSEVACTVLFGPSERVTSLLTGPELGGPVVYPTDGEVPSSPVDWMGWVLVTSSVPEPCTVELWEPEGEYPAGGLGLVPEAATEEGVAVEPDTIGEPGIAMKDDGVSGESPIVGRDVNEAAGEVPGG